MKLSDCQSKAVNELVSKFDINNKKIVYFQAPTGSGKTFMIANVIDKLILQYPNDKLTFVIATLSSADLPKQMLENLNEYKNYLTNRELLIERKESPSATKSKVKDGYYQIQAKQNNVLILGTQSFGQGRIFTEQGILDSFLSQITNEGYKLVYIRDEAHYGGEAKKINNKYKEYSSEDNYEQELGKIKKSEQRFEYMMQHAAHYIIKMTATPKDGNAELISIDEKDLEEDNIVLLKKTSKYNDGLQAIEEDKITNEQILDIACKKFKWIKDRYANIELEPELQHINPAMLIQVKDEYKDEQQEFAKQIDNIISILKKNNLNWVKYFGVNDIESNIRLDSNSLKSISKNNSDVDVIIFKIGPATGWNIPRACMLVQLRNVSSESLNVQTLGRIKRNPNPEANYLHSSIALNYYYYSNIEESKKIRVTLTLKNEFANEQFKVGYIDTNVLKEIKKNPKYSEEIITLLELNRSDSVKLKQSYDFYKSQYNEFNKLIITKEKFGNKEIIVKEINNSIELEIYKENFLYENRMYFSKDIIKNIEDRFFKTFNIKDPASEYGNFSVNLLWFIISITKINEIKEKFYQTTKDKENEKMIYKVKNTSLPLNNDYFLKDLKNSINLWNIEEYAYQNLKEKSQGRNSNYFDSEVETRFITDFKDYLVQNNNIKNKYYFKIWTKNPVFHGIYMQYFDELTDIRKSFPDIIIRINNKKVTHDFYIELKHKDDKSLKINNILNGYKKYIDNNEEPLFSRKNDLTLLVIKVDKNKNKYNFQGISSNIKINEKIENDKDNYNFITFLDTLFNLI